MSITNNMFPQQAAMASQKPETFMLSTEAQQSLPHDAQVALQQVDNLKYFLISAPVDWQSDQYIRRFLLPTGEYVSCVLWNNLFHISGTDIVRCLSFRFQAFGRPVKNSKKFEEGIFSDLRNLKSGTDASLEEPKSAFLDFLYKNNCIRTQKKQKVFYWYSVPHDRLFLDALERDLKREKMSQEATTVAVSEPALSFQYDSSQSLFEQLTKSQQANSSSFNAQQPAFTQSQSASPVMRAMEPMPPPNMIPHSVASLPEGINSAVPYEQMAMAPALPQQVAAVKRDADFTRVHYNQNGIPIAQNHQRHSSMPAYGLEYSPAPSFVSSGYEDYSNRAISFEPITPPQQALGMSTEPAHAPHEETGGLCSVVPDHFSHMNGLNNMVQLPPTNMGGAHHFPRSYGASNVYSVIEGSPTYKQRRRRTSIPPSLSAVAVAPTSTPSVPHRLTDLRRPIPAPIGAVTEGDESAGNSPPGLGYGGPVMVPAPQHKDVLDLSRHGTPLSAVGNSPGMHPVALPQEYPHIPTDDLSMDSSLNDRRVMSGSTGVIRRARSATVMELGPYPNKSHSCPIPTCGRLFKRLEHLKRHVRTHTQEKPYVCSVCCKAFSRSDNLAQHRRTHSREDGCEAMNLSVDEEEEFSGEEQQLGSVDETTPPSDSALAGGPVSAPASDNSAVPTNTVAPSQSYGNLQSLNMSIPINQPTAINAGGAM